MKDKKMIKINSKDYELVKLFSSTIIEVMGEKYQKWYFNGTGKDNKQYLDYIKIN